MTIKTVVDQLVEEYKEAISMRAEDLTDPEVRARHCHDCGITDEELTEAYVQEYCIDGVACQHNYPHNEASDRAIVRECVRRLTEMGAVASFDVRFGRAA